MNCLSINAKRKFSADVQKIWDVSCEWICWAKAIPRGCRYFASLCDSKSPQVNKLVLSSAQSSNKHSNFYQDSLFSMPDLPDFQNAKGQVLAIREMAPRKKSYSLWEKWKAVALFPNPDSETPLGKASELLKGWIVLSCPWCHLSVAAEHGHNFPLSNGTMAVLEAVELTPNLCQPLAPWGECAQA